MVDHPSILGTETEQQRRHRSRRALLVAAAVIVGIFLLSAVAPTVWAVRTWIEIRRLDRGFAQIERGMTIEEVYAIMQNVAIGDPQTTPHNGAWWMDKPLPAAETSRIKTTHTWRPVLLPFLRYEITYDAADRVVGKRRYD
ncbi:MAG: hypothetical protein WBC44_14160 [Planctomycetaceae bacterium]